MACERGAAVPAVPPNWRAGLALSFNIKRQKRTKEKIP